MKRLVIVESPTKAKTIRGFLPTEYHVEASMGHVRDLPESASEIPESVKGKDWATLGVNVQADFEPLYVVSPKKKKVVTQLKNALKEADELIVATDEDREGESIGWHLVQVLKPKVPVRRMVFHEITREAIQNAIKHYRAIDENLVRAQETRRILDRLVGYTVSPLLWKKIAPGLSAGRVQSVAVRLLVQREQQRLAFKSGEYWDLRALLSPLKDLKSEFEASLTSVGGVRVATSKDFDETTGKIAKGKNVLLLNAQDAKALRDRLIGGEWRVTDLSEKSQIRKPAPPFTTSTLQQEANRKLKFSGNQTMQIAQKLYEEGYITYMRTDSVHLSSEAVNAARQEILARFGADYLSPAVRRYATTSKGAQEAHEAIRPAGNRMRSVDELGLSGREAALYDMIWKRTIATQMADAHITLITVEITVADALFGASGKRIDFPGFFRAYVEGSDDPESALEDREVKLPPLTKGDPLRCKTLDPVGHETQPPARYTEAALVQTLEREGIGRPSTYATIIGTIQDRGYVVKANNQLVPTFTAFAVNRLLEGNFPALVDIQFTARMEQELDDISTGQAAWLPYLKGFFLGEKGLEAQVQEKAQTIDPREIYALDLADIHARVRIGRFGPYLEQHNGGGNELRRVSLPENLAPADLNAETATQLIQQKESGPDVLGYHPKTREPIFVLNGRFGPYVQMGEAKEKGDKPRRASLLRGMKPESVTLDTAVALLSLPRPLGRHPESGKVVEAGVGRYGPYVHHDDDYRSLAPSDDVLTVDFARAMQLLSEPKAKRGERKSPTPLRELGPHPGDGEPVVLMDGQFGPYVKHGKINATLPRGTDPKRVTMEQAVALIAEKAAKPASKRPVRKSSGRTGTASSQAKTKKAPDRSGKPKPGAKARK
ncbi:MAG TPA: type I DNA topoisomerase [Aggregatilineales bacterium]|nr:type I DNA topoisomerase [Aggregatilineales bacterium]